MYDTKSERKILNFTMTLLATATLLVASASMVMTNGTAYALPSKFNVEITSHDDGSKVPTGKLTISGTSTDDGTSKTEDCEVYVDWNDMKPYQEVTPTGPGGSDDYSTWKFTYTSNYHLIVKGDNNELTAKFYCQDDDSLGVDWDTINVVGAKHKENQHH